MKPNTSNNMSKTSASEHSAGGCVYKKEGDQIFWLLGKHSGYHKWVLPKGLIESGETNKQTAVREIQEELAIIAKIIGDSPIHTISYTYQAVPRTDQESIRRVKTYQEDPEFQAQSRQVTIHKTVDFFLLEYISGDPKDHGWEMEDGGWFEFDQALDKLEFKDEKKALQLAQQKLKQI